MNYPLSALPFDLGFTLLALALFRYGQMLKILVRIMEKPGIHLLPLLAAFLLLGTVAIHVYVSALVIPALDMAEGAAFDTLFATASRLRFLSLGLLTLAGLFTASAGLIYYRWINR